MKHTEGSRFMLRSVASDRVKVCVSCHDDFMETHDLTLAEAARAVGLHVETLRRLARAGQIETYVVNPGSRRPHFRVTPAALQAFRTRGRRAARPVEASLQTAEAPPDISGPPFVVGIIPGTMSRAEMIAFWKQNGVFDTPWPQ